MEDWISSRSSGLNVSLYSLVTSRHDSLNITNEDIIAIYPWAIWWFFLKFSLILKRDSFTFMIKIIQRIFEFFSFHYASQWQTLPRITLSNFILFRKSWNHRIKIIWKIVFQSQNYYFNYKVSMELFYNFSLRYNIFSTFFYYCRQSFSLFILRYLHCIVHWLRMLLYYAQCTTKNKWLNNATHMQ